MPAYDYKCKACGHRFEKTQRITEPSGALCPACGDAACERLITGGTFHLKGSGWYASDYANKKAPEAAGGTAKDEATDTAKTAAVEATPAASGDALAPEKAATVAPTAAPKTAG